MATKEFFELVRTIGETRSKEEETAIIQNEVTKLRAFCATPDAGAAQPRRQREHLIRLIYCEMMGVPVPFGYMTALNCTQSKRIDIKRAGYLAVSLFLYEKHDLNLLNTNTMDKGLKSPNVLEICAALTALCQLLDPKTIPMFYASVLPLLKHNKSSVRKKAVVALHAMLTRRGPEDDGSMPGALGLLRESLCDKDPCVMAATLVVLRDLLLRWPASAMREVAGLVPALVSILSQVVTRKLPKAYDYGTMPAPWIQVHLVDILGELGRGNASASSQMRDGLAACLNAAAGQRLGAGSMVVYACVRAITKIVSSESLQQLAATQITAFLRSGKPNLRYLGLRAMAVALAGSDDAGSGADSAPVAEGGFGAMLAAREEHQLAVVETLESDDETLRRETLHLLYRMATESNATVIAGKLLETLRRDSNVAGSMHVRSELIARVTQLAERFSPTPRWYLETITSVLELGGSLVQSEIAESLSRVMENESSNSGFITYAAAWFVQRIDESLIEGATPLPPLLARVGALLLAEHGGNVPGQTVEHVVESLCQLVEQVRDNPDVQAVIISSATKLFVQHSASASAPECLAALLSKYRNSCRLDVQQRCYECSSLLEDLQLARIVMLTPEGQGDIHVDPALAFLDGYVKRAVSSGARKYAPRSSVGGFVFASTAAPLSSNITRQPSHKSLVETGSTTLHMEAYPAPKPPTVPLPMVAPTPPESPRVARSPADASSTQNAVPQATAGSTSPAKAPSLVTLAAKKSAWSASGWSAASTASCSDTSAGAAVTACPKAPASGSSTPSSNPVSKALQANQAARSSKLQPASNPQEDERRARMAKELFGGKVQGASSSGMHPRQRSVTPTGTKSSAAPLVQSPPAGVGAGPASPSTSTPPAAHRNAIEELLGLGDGSYEAPKKPQPLDVITGAAPSSSSLSSLPKVPKAQSLEDILSTAPSPPKIQPTPVITPVRASVPSTAFTFTSAGMSSGPQAPPLQSRLPPDVPSEGFKHADVINVASLPSTPFTSAEITAFMSAMAEPKTAHLVASSGALGMYLLKVYRRDCLGIALLINNLSGSEVVTQTAQTSITLEDVTGTDGSAPVLYEVLPAPTVLPDGPRKLLVSRLPNRLSALAVVKMRIRNPVAPSSTPLYLCGALNGSRWQSEPVTMGDWLRPMKMTTKQVGELWAAHSQERKCSLPIAGSGDVSSTMKNLGERVKAHCTEVIGTEAILVSTASLSTAQQQTPLCFLHCRADLDSRQVRITVRAETAALAESVGFFVQSLAL